MVHETEGRFLISQIKQIGGRVFERILLQSGIDAFNGAQGRILYVLWKNDHIPIIDLSRKTGLAKTTLTSMLDRLEASGLITRIDDKGDRRKILIALTDKAKSLQADFDRVSAKMNGIYYKGFSDDEIRQFEDYLRRILNNLKEEMP